MLVRSLCLIACALLLGCPGGGSSAAGGATPQEAFAAFKRALLSGDAPGIWANTAPDARPDLVFDALSDAEVRALVADRKTKTRDVRTALSALKERHGMPSRLSGPDLRASLTEAVSDLRAFYLDLIAFHEGEVEDADDPDVYWGELAEAFRIEGKEARALMVRYPDDPQRPDGFYDWPAEQQQAYDLGLERQREQQAGKRVETEVLFVQRDGRWYYHSDFRLGLKPY
ncbi:MAG: hypothetical protein R3F62_18165 [Planctomycetota bacterium]